MCFPLPQLEISNIKISLFTTTSLSPYLGFIGKFAIRIYKNSPQLINVTGINSFDKIRKIRSKLKKKFKVKIRKKYRIDNIMASRKLNFIFDFEKIIKTIKNNEYD